jgi:hypothetical protein
MHKTKNVLILALGFMLVGLLVVFFTHNSKPNNIILISQENYLVQVNPWLSEVSLDPSLTTVTRIKEQILDLKGDQSIGQSHITLFMAFDSWEKYLLTGDISNKDRSINHLITLEDLLPEVAREIQNLKNILKAYNV